MLHVLFIVPIGYSRTLSQDTPSLEEVSLNEVDLADLDEFLKELVSNPYLVEVVFTQCSWIFNGYNDGVYLSSLPYLWKSLMIVVF